MDEAERLCDRVAIMDHGKVIALGTPRELIRARRAEHVVTFSAAHAGRIDLHTLRAIDGVLDARPENGGFELDVTELHRAVPALLSALNERGIEMNELQTHSATLEDVFVSLTGRHLRDD